MGKPSAGSRLGGLGRPQEVVPVLDATRAEELQGGAVALEGACGALSRAAPPGRLCMLLFCTLIRAEAVFLDRIAPIQQLQHRLPVCFLIRR